MADPLADLRSKGVSIWLDDLSRQRLAAGSLTLFDASWRELGDELAATLRHPGGRPIREGSAE